MRVSVERCQKEAFTAETYWIFHAEEVLHLPVEDFPIEKEEVYDDWVNWQVSKHKVN